MRRIAYVFQNKYQMSKYETQEEGLKKGRSNWETQES